MFCALFHRRQLLKVEKSHASVLNSVTRAHPQDPITTEFTHAITAAVCDKLLRAFVLRLPSLGAGWGAEILALRHQLLILQRSSRDHKLRLRWTDRVLRIWLSRLWNDFATDGSVHLLICYLFLHRYASPIFSNSSGSFSTISSSVFATSRTE